MWAIGRADLNKTEKAFLYGLVTVMNWRLDDPLTVTVSAETIGSFCGHERRSMQIAAGRLARRGVLSISGKRKGGIKRDGNGIANAYRLNLKALEAQNRPTNPASSGEDQIAECSINTTPNGEGKCAPGAHFKCASGAGEVRTPRPESAHLAPLKCAPGAHNQGSDSKKNQNTINSPSADVVARILGSRELLNHPNATEERLAFIAREAETKDNPAGWAASCIRDGWPLPGPTSQQILASMAVDYEARMATFYARDHGEQAEILQRVYRKFPNLRGKPPEAPGMRGAIHKCLDAPSEATLPAASPVDLSQIGQSLADADNRCRSTSSSRGRRNTVREEETWEG